MPDTLPPLAYGVWIPEWGWLKYGGRAFADTKREVAEAAAKLYGDHAEVIPVDAPDTAMLELEATFLEQERKREREREARRWVNRIRKALSRWVDKP